MPRLGNFTWAATTSGRGRCLEKPITRACPTRGQLCQQDHSKKEKTSRHPRPEAFSLDLPLEEERQHWDEDHQVKASQWKNSSPSTSTHKRGCSSPKKDVTQSHQAQKGNQGAPFNHHPSQRAHPEPLPGDEESPQAHHQERPAPWCSHSSPTALQPLEQS